MTPGETTQTNQTYPTNRPPPNKMMIFFNIPAMAYHIR